MSDWSWVAVGFGIAYGGVAGYVLALLRRARRVRRQRGDVR